MKAARSSIRLLSVMVVAGCFGCLPKSFAAPGGGPSNGTGAAASGGSHTVSAAPAAGGHSGHVSAGVAARPAMSAGSGFHSSVGPANTVGFNRASSGISPAAGMAMGPRLGAAQTGMARPLPQMPTVRNAWTDSSNPRVTGGVNTAARQYGNHVGNNLYPSAYGYVPTRPASGHSQHGPNGDYRGDHHRHYYNNFPYAVYYPYLYSNYGYGGIGNYGYDGGAISYSGVTTDNNVADLGAPDFTNTPNNYYSYVEPEQNERTPNAPSEPARTLPDTPDVGPQTPTATTGKTSSIPQGPDSLVEAVQDELSRRGYFAGKADAVYGPSTKEAIRRFQGDQHLPASGLINEATLHALHLD